MKKLIALVLACLMLLSLCSCGKNIKELKKGESVEIAYSQDGADKAYKALEKDLKNKDSEISKIQMNFEINEKDIYEITPKNSEEKTGFKVYKDITNNCAFLYSEEEIVPLYASLSSSLGIFSGYSINTISLTDINKDGNYEYIYTFSFGSGQNKQGVEIFDLATKKHSNLILGDDFKNHIVTYSTNDEFCHIYGAKVSGDEATSKYTIEQKVGEVRYTPGKGFYYESVTEK